MAGNIVIDSSSSVTATLKEKSSLTGHINNGNTAKSVNLTLDSSSSWNVTADSYLTGLSDADGISGLSVTNITGNGHNVHYDASLAANSYLGGKTYALANGGELLPSGGSSCSYTVTPSATSFVYGGGSGSIAVETSDGCSWTAKSDSSWLSITAGSSGSGSGKVSFTVAANPANSARAATLSVAGKTLTITQEACSGCSTVLPGKATLVSPSGPSAPALPMYVWNAVASATWYQLWVNDSEKSPKVQIWYTADQVSCAAGTGTCSIAPAVKLAVGNATWWIQTWNDAGYGPWSDAMSFSVVTCSLPGKAGLVSPSGYVSITKPTFSWRAVPGSEWYYLWVNDSVSAAKVKQWYTAAEVGCSSGTMICSITPDVTLAAGWGEWWVEAWNQCGSGTYGPWSDGVVFYAGSDAISPAEITSPTPDSDLTSSTITFTWNAGTGASQYWLQVGMHLGGSELYNGDQGSGLSVALPGLPRDGSPIHVRLWSYINGQWYWRDYSFRACNGCS